jgi:putative Ca2+/H+ antiporter (TMEM165/GDT1 family)
MLIGAIFGIILCVMFATMTGHYIQGAFWGAVLGALGGCLILSWPPERTTGE